MGPVAVLDTSVVLAILDPEDSLHTAAVRAVRQLRDDDIRFVLPATAFAEVLVGTARQGATDLADRRRQVIAAFGNPHAQSVVTGDRKWRGIQPNVKVVGR